MVETGRPSKVAPRRQRIPVGGQTLPGPYGDHIPAHRVDDLFSAHQGAQSHKQGTQSHEPQGDYKDALVGPSLGQGGSQEKNADKFLAVLRPVQK